MERNTVDLNNCKTDRYCLPLPRIPYFTHIDIFF